MSLDRQSVVALTLDKQHLTAASAADDVQTVLSDLLGLHATDLTSPYLQLHARMRRFEPAQLDAELDAGRAAKLACMRRTLFIEPVALVALVLTATRELTARDRERFLAAHGLTPARYEQLAKRVAATLAGRALDARGLRSELAGVGSLSPVLIVMCDQARLLRWKGRRGWRSTPPAYRRFADALPDVRFDDWEEGTAVRELVGRYVRRYGPVTETDIAWWTGFRKQTVQDAVAALPGVVRTGVRGLGGTFLIHESDLDDLAGSPAGEVALLPVLDPYLQGYRERGRAIETRHEPFVVDRGGNATSVIAVDGRAAGVWDFVSQPSPELRLFFFDGCERATRRRVHTLAGQTAALLAEAPAQVVEVERMTPLTDHRAGRFLSPLKDVR